MGKEKNIKVSHLQSSVRTPSASKFRGNVRWRWPGARHDHESRMVALNCACTLYPRLLASDTLTWAWTSPSHNAPTDPPWDVRSPQPEVIALLIPPTSQLMRYQCVLAGVSDRRGRGRDDLAHLHRAHRAGQDHVPGVKRHRALGRLPAHAP